MQNSDSTAMDATYETMSITAQRRSMVRWGLRRRLGLVSAYHEKTVPLRYSNFTHRLTITAGGRRVVSNRTNSLMAFELPAQRAHGAERIFGPESN
jgi:hypothetical protein